MRRSAHESVGKEAGIFSNATIGDAPYAIIQNPVGSSARKPEKVIQIEKELAVP
jgi:hypothetical protein